VYQVLMARGCDAARGDDDREELFHYFVVEVQCSD
jgi:hypothetical protein